MTAVESHMTYSNSYTINNETVYMTQEDDWDRDLLLDPAWEKQQRKVRLDLEAPSACAAVRNTHRFTHSLTLLMSDFLCILT